MMKKAFTSVAKAVFFAVVVASIWSCAPENEDNPPLGPYAQYALSPQREIHCTANSIKEEEYNSHPNPQSLLSHWNVGDRIRVNDAELTIDSVPEAKSLAYFGGMVSPIEIEDNQEIYFSVYPSDLISSPTDWGGNHTLTPLVKIPSRQIYQESDEIRFLPNNYMAAYTMVKKGTNNIHFYYKNLCCVFRFGLRTDFGTQKVSKLCLYTNNSEQTGFHGNSGVLAFHNNGIFATPTIQWNDRNANTHAARNCQRKLTLDCTQERGGYVEVGGEYKYFLLMLPINLISGITEGELCLEIFNEDSTRMMRLIRRNITLRRSFYYYSNITLDMDRTGFVDADFSVSPTKVAKFSKGNLQWLSSINGIDSTSLTHQTQDGTRPGLWRFAIHQYDFVGGDDDNTGTVASLYSEKEWDATGSSLINRARVSPDWGHEYSTNTRTLDRRKIGIDWIDLFGFATSGYGPRPWMVDGSDTDSPSYTGNIADITGTYYDWGIYNAISNGGNKAGQWRLLSWLEWKYILRDRTKADEKIAFATITDAVQEWDGRTKAVKGVVLLPDVFVFPNSVFESAWKPFKSRNSWSDDKCIAPSSVDFDNNRYTVEQWTQMEKAGAVFLPASGCRLGNVLYYCQTKGYSYTSNRSTKSPSTSTNHYFFFGENGSPAISYDCDVSREDKYGRGVRLAMDW